MTAIPTKIRGRFARSVRLDAAGPSDLDGYLPTTRALDVVRRVVRGMSTPDGSRAFSITGPYGSGKSSLAVFLDALCSGEASLGYQRAVALLQEHDPETVPDLQCARATFGIPSSGMARAVVTAPQREPIAVTVLRALSAATHSFRSSKQLRARVAEALSRALDEKLSTPAYHEIHALVVEIAARRPLLLLIDEFGKNLEAYSDSGADGDLYLLQELAEWASGTEDPIPMVLVTIQHLAFEAYAASASATKRREWAKVQGRFEDIPYVDSATATRHLIAVALDHGNDPLFNEARVQIASGAAEGAAAAGLPEVASADLLTACWPLHPSTLLVLPELCARYGQNERTLFSFLASPEPLSATSWLKRQSLESLGWVRLDRVYDYFVESAGNFVAASEDVSRWNEVLTAIRDAHGLSDGQRRVLKTIGVLNLVAATGMLRASEELVTFACADGQVGTEDEAAVRLRLSELEAAGLLTYRDYAHEYRIWRGSDFDINAALRVARRASEGVSPAMLLADIRPMQPLVAARHSTRTGTVRAFARIYADVAHATVSAPDARSVCDGLLVYRLDEAPLRIDAENGCPVVVVDADDLSEVRKAAIEVAALLNVLQDPSLPRDDRAARRELSERTAHARLHLDRAVTAAFDSRAAWTWLNPSQGDARRLHGGVATARLSSVLDQAYNEGPPHVAYEAINRSELTSAGARARKIVQGALVTPSVHTQPQLGLEGDGAEVAIYRAVLQDSGIHDPTRGLGPPAVGQGWRAVWDTTLREMADVPAPVTADHLLNVMMAPPFGLREGTASLLLTALVVVESASLVIYEHGTFIARLTAPVVERLVRNPKNFGLKHLGTSRRGRRWEVIQAVHDALDSQGLSDRPNELTVLSTVQRLVSTYRYAHSSYVANTRLFDGPDNVSARVVGLASAIRDVLAEAREPDVLLFSSLPDAVGLPPVRTGRNSLSQEQVDDFATRLAEGLKLLATANDRLALAAFDRATLAAVPLDVSGRPLERIARLRALEATAAAIESVHTVSARVRAFLRACLMNASNPIEMGVQIATGVTGVSPKDWTDHDAPRHLAELEDAARAFRRIADLARARASYASGDRSFDAYAIAVTSPDGRTIDRVVTLTAEDREDVTAAVETAIESLGHLGNRALEAFLAATSARAIGDHQNESRKPAGGLKKSRGSAQHG